MRDNGLMCERDKDLYKVYLTALREQDLDSMYAAAEWCRNQPAPRFYISARSLYSYILRIEREYREYGTVILGGLHRLSREKVLDLYEMYYEYMKEHPYCTDRMSLCERLVEQPAPKFYLEVDRAYQILSRKCIEAKERLVKWHNR